MVGAGNMTHDMAVNFKLLQSPSNPLKTESESELLYYWQFTSNQFVLATSPLRPTTRISFFELNTCGYSPYVTSSLTRGWVVYNCWWSLPVQSFSGLSPELCRETVTVYCENHTKHTNTLYLSKARTVEPEQQSLLANGSETSFVSRQQLQNKQWDNVHC
jgi:hypothetical protein